nr:HlyD family efflux transporter periplasmic adaptor subunit [Tissierella sp.]
MKNKNTGKWIIGILVVALLAFLVFRVTRKDEVKGEEIEVEEGDIATYYNFSGSISARNRSVLFAEMPLQVKEFLFEEGEKVEEGDIIYKTSLGEEVKSEIDGEVYKIEAEEDEQIAPGSKIMEIVDYNNLELKVNVDEYDLKSIKVGSEVEVAINALDKTVKGEVSDIAKQGEYINGITLFETTISIEKLDDIRIGMSAEAKVLDQEAKNAAILPMKTIKFKNDNSPYVEVKGEEKVEERQIEIGITDGVNVEVVSGLKIGDKVFIPRKVQSNFGPPEGVRDSRDESGDDRND